MADQFGGIPVEEPKTDQFGGTPSNAPQPDVDYMVKAGLAGPVTREMVNSNSVVSDVARAFMGEENWKNPLGFTRPAVDYLTEHGILTKDQAAGPASVIKAFEDSFFFPAAAARAAHTFNDLYHGLQEAGIAAGLHPDIVSIPDAFFGSPHPMGIPRAGEIPHEASASVSVGEAAQGAIARAQEADKTLSQARDLGVIGPAKPDTAAMPPKLAAETAVPDRNIAAAVRKDETISGPINPARDKAGNIRLDQIGINADAKEVMIKAAEANDDFNDARQGNVPLAQIESLTEASGIPSRVLTENDGLGRLMRNDAVVRTWMQAFHQATDEIAEQMSLVARTGDEADIATLREMKLRFQHMQEQVSGLTAEAGRTLRVFRDFYENRGKAEAVGKLIGDNPGLDVNSLKKLADMGKGLNSREQVARLLNDSRQPTFWDKYLFYWVNALISGPVTHTKYVLANGAFAGYEAGVVTPIAGGVGAIRRAITGGSEGVYAGEAAARLYGLLAGTPDALRAAWTAAKENIQVPLPGEVAKGTNPVINMKPNPIGGLTGMIVGIPSRGATGIHSFFNFLGYRAEIEAQAYRAAAKEGLSPLNDEFWQRRQWHAANPTEAMMDAGIENGYHLTFISEQGKVGKAVSDLTRKIPALKLIIPFNHIPGQIMRAGLEQTPAAFLDERMRADLLGKNGAVKQDMQIARLVGGGAISAMVANWALNDGVTGYGPTDPTERAIWLRTHEPYSVRLGGWWVSYNKFGPIGDLMGIVANLVDVGPKVKEGEYAEAAGRVVKGASRLLEDEVGMQGLVNLIEAMEDPDNKMGRFLSGQAASNLPYSSLLRQTASISDPYMREAKTFVDQLRYAVPYARQGLLPKIDWLGQPVANPGYASILRARVANENPIDQEIEQLGGAVKPGPPQDRIGGVKLTPDLYHEYQIKAGALTNTMLNAMVTQPNWQDLPPGIRANAIHHSIEGSRKAAEAVMQATHPALIRAGIEQKMNQIANAGRKPKRAPEGLE